MSTADANMVPSRTEIDAFDGPMLLEFGASWCGYCVAAQTSIAQALGKHARVRHLKIEDGRGQPLGRSFRVKIWPTLIFLKQGKEIERLVRPADAKEIEQALIKIDLAT